MMLTGNDDENGGLPIHNLPASVRLLFERLEAHRDHAAYEWFEKIGNGFFEDDWGIEGLPIPGPICRFRRGDRVAYIWAEEAVWLVQGWRGLRAKACSTPMQVGSFRDALDLLARKRQWWQIWG